MIDILHLTFFSFCYTSQLWNAFHSLVLKVEIASGALVSVYFQVIIHFMKKGFELVVKLNIYLPNNMTFFVTRTKLTVFTEVRFMQRDKASDNLWLHDVYLFHSSLFPYLF